MRMVRWIGNYGGAGQREGQVSKYDRSDPDWRVSKLVSISHHLWRLRAILTHPIDQDGPILEALETVWRLKRELKAEIAAEKSRKWQERVGRVRSIPTHGRV